ncbi:gamma-glutamyl-gamma-aminobutyrate hydrolase family protein [Leifsonia sp. NPDC056665]|uniref:gamma-glutamyl-gamma-aminobutyrate hydrolase family protein n=1 Tax=Leifsonia sp. NPDC056665 TaxID=3345901 RepID=UPI00368C8A02
MNAVAITMRRDFVQGRHEVRDALESAWWDLLSALGHIPLVIPNHAGHAQALIEAFRPQAVILTGGGLPGPSDDSSERDRVETLLIDYAGSSALPLLGVCRGMQAIALRFGGSLCSVTGHVGTRSGVTSRFGTHDAHCFHEYALMEAPAGFVPLAIAFDGSIEAIEHRTRPIRAVMWHPERAGSLGQADTDLLRDSLKTA